MFFENQGLGSFFMISIESYMFLMLEFQVSQEARCEVYDVFS